MINKFINYFRASIKRKIARRVTKEYPARVDVFNLKEWGKVEFANWENPLVEPITLTYEMVQFFKKFIKAGDLVIDIGANIGDTTVPMALCAGAPGMAIGFDPNPFVFKVLEKNASLNKDKTNILAFQNAISVDEEEFYFVSSEASFGNGGISKTAQSPHGKFVHPKKVKGINLENFLEKNFKERLDKFSFIKIDTEGYDKEIIKSISGLIEKYKPVIVAECFASLSSEEKMELYDVIKQHGYDIYYFSDFDINAEIKKLDNRNDITKWHETINIYGVPVS